MADQPAIDERKSYNEAEDEFRDTADNARNIEWYKVASALAIGAGLAQTVISSILVASAPTGITIALLIFGVLFLGAGVHLFIWSRKISKGFGATGSVYHIEIDDRETKAVFIYGLLFAFVAAMLYANIGSAGSYSADLLNARYSFADDWEEQYGDDLPEDYDWVDCVFTLMGLFQLFFILIFLSASRIAYKINVDQFEIMRYVVFLGCVFLFSFSLFLVGQAQYVGGYAEYPVLHKIWPSWTDTGLFALGITTCVLAWAGIGINFRKWRLGFFFFSVFLLTWISISAIYVGYSYGYASYIYNFYSGSEAVCADRMDYVDHQELVDAGCPSKYADSCEDVARVAFWEAHSPPKSSWVTMAQSLKLKSVGVSPDLPDGNPWTITVDGTIYYLSYTDNYWYSVEGSAERIRVGPNNVPWVVNSDGNLYSRTTNRWDLRHKDILDVAAGADGAVYAVGTDNKLYLLDDEDWSQKDEVDGIQAIRVAVGPNDIPWVITPEAKVFRWVEDEWVEAQGQLATDISIGADGSIWIAGTDLVNYKWSDKKWNKGSGSDVVSISVGPRGQVWIVQDNGTIKTQSYCLNLGCCGILGQVYAQPFLNLANWGLLSLLSAVLASVGSYYFWTRTHPGDQSTEIKHKDFIWLGIKGAMLIAFFVYFFALDDNYIREYTDDGKHF